MLLMEIGAKCAWFCRTILSKRPCRFSLGVYSGSLRPGCLCDRPEFFAFRCYSSRDPSPIAFLAQRNFTLATPPVPYGDAMTGTQAYRKHVAVTQLDYGDGTSDGRSYTDTFGRQA